MRYRAQVHHNGLRPDDIVDLAPEQLEEWQGEIDRGFLVRVDPEPSFAPSFVDTGDSAGHAWSVDDPDADLPPVDAPTE